MYFIDTNIFLEWLLGRKNAAECEKLFEAVETGEIEAACSHFSIHSICIYLAGNNKIKEAEKFLKFILAAEKMQVINTTISDDLKAIKSMEKTGLDFDDTIQYYIATETNCESIITFDKDFKRAGIGTFTPKEILG